jgi:3-oxoacyl-[acyl-carrier protein] reductase
MSGSKKTILITGGSRGIGKATADLLKEAGYQVLAPSSKELDVSSELSVKKYFAANFKTKSELYALICNAGIHHSASLAEHSLADWQKVIDINLTGTFRACKHALNYLRNSKHSHIIMISSVSAAGEAFAPAYTASKAGINGLCKALAYELATDGINVNTIAPGWVRTDMAQKILHNQELVKNHLGATLQNRWIEPSEIASLVRYLISEEARAITGQVLTMDAGL